MSEKTDTSPLDIVATHSVKNLGVNNLTLRQLMEDRDSISKIITRESVKLMSELEELLLAISKEDILEALKSRHDSLTEDPKKIGPNSERIYFRDEKKYSDKLRKIYTHIKSIDKMIEGTPDPAKQDLTTSKETIMLRFMYSEIKEPELEDNKTIDDMSWYVDTNTKSPNETLCKARKTLLYPKAKKYFPNFQSDTINKLSKLYWDIICDMDCKFRNAEGFEFKVIGFIDGKKYTGSEELKKRILSIIINNKELPKQIDVIDTFPLSIENNQYVYSKIGGIISESQKEAQKIANIMNISIKVSENHGSFTIIQPNN